MRRIRKAKIEFISLVPAGANMLQPVYKTDGTVSFGALTKASDNFDEAGELTAVVYAPEHRDSQGDIASAEVVKQMAYDFVANGAKVDIRHDGKALPPEKARVGETFIVQKSDERFHGWKDKSGKDVDLTGAWATVIKIDDPELRQKYRNGEWAGVSMGGTAIVDQEKSATLDDFVAAIQKALNPTRPTEPESDTMNEEQFKILQKSLTDGFASLGESLTKALAPKTDDKKVEDKKTEDKKVEKKAPVFKGDYGDEVAVRKHAIALEMFKLEKETDMEDPEQFQDFMEKSAELRAELAELKELQPEPTRQRRTTFRKAGPGAGGEHAASNVPDFLQVLPVSKEEHSAMAAGAAMADLHNKRLTGAKE